jgi:acetyl esterase
VPVDPCFAPLLADPHNELRPIPAHIPLEDVRAGNKAFQTAAPTVALHAVDDLVIDGPAGTLALRVYRPEARANLPVCMFMHGGGFVLGDLDTHDSICSRIARGSGAVVVSVDYRLAPETRFPGAIDDCASALRWIATTGHRALGIDPARMALCGDSAGGHLAVVVALRSRDRGAALRHVGLLYPVIDPSCNSASMLEFARGYLLTRSGMRWLWDQYLTQPGDAQHVEVGLLRRDVSGLPPTTIITAEFDPLRDEGEAFAKHLAAAGVTVTLRRYAGMVHGFAGLPHVTPAADQALGELASELRAALA